MFLKNTLRFLIVLCFSLLLSACKKEQVVGSINTRKADLGKKNIFRQSAF